jgi:hypothetical protein
MYAHFVMVDIFKRKFKISGLFGYEQPAMKVAGHTRK